MALVIGNSRRHWARFRGETLESSWDEDYDKTESHDPLPAAVCGGNGAPGEPCNPVIPDVPLWLASVVPEQSRVWADVPNVRVLTLTDVPLLGMYPTFGIDRALALWGAIATVGSPVLVIDGGTALTFTGADATQTFVGGAILPGLRLQFEALGQKTAVLANVDGEPQKAVARVSGSRWARTTEAAIASGIMYTVMAGIQAFIQDWRQQCPGSPVVLTGGDRDSLHQWLHQKDPAFARSIVVDAHLIFHGIQAVKACCDQ